MRPWLVGLAIEMVVTSAPAVAQDSLPPWEGGLTRSIGQPRQIRYQAGGSIGADWRSGGLNPVGFVHGAMSRSFGNPVTGMLGGTLEGFVGFRGTDADIGLRALLSIPTLRLSGGVEIGARDGEVVPIFGVTAPVRRGGVFGGGSLVRLEWLPGAGKGLRISTMAPVGEPWAGHTRPSRSTVQVPDRAPSRGVAPPVSPSLTNAIANLGVAAQQMTERIVPLIDAPGPSATAALGPVLAGLRAPPSLPGFLPDGTIGTDQITRIYHRELVRAFSIAESGREVAFGEATPVGETLARRARTILLDHVLYPFNRLLGQKRNAEAFRALARYARGGWARELVGQEGMSPAAEARILATFEQWIEVLDAVRASQLRSWGDSRLQWMPLQLALLPEEHDSQAELDRIVEAAVGQPFTDGNEVWYVVNGQFQREITASIFAAKDYHVLWIHDFRGLNQLGEPDASSLRSVADAYLGALTAAIQAYDARRRLPMYLIFLDEHYYEANRGRVWLDFLERPLGPLPRLPKGFASFDSTVARAQASLRRAIEGSRLLQAEERQYGAAWLENLIKVHVNITNPADMSFWASDIVPIIGMPDNLMRDHRKIAFYDVTEEDPYRGLGIYTGMGIGEHYLNSHWEDRAIMAKGPVLLTLKEQARRLLLSHGLSESEIPYPLRPVPKAADYEDRVRQFARGVSREHDQRAMELHNLTGYQVKPINVAKATLYTLMPPGSVIKTPDSLWGSALWASLLTGSALRGSRVLVVAPSLASAPASNWPSMALAHDLLSRLIVVQQDLGAEIEAAGGLLKTGLYNPGVGVNDVLRRFGGAYQNARRTPFLRRLFPVDPNIDSMLARYRALAATTPPAADAPAPKLHLKANWFSSREAWDSLIGRPELKEVVEAYILQLLRPDRDTVGAQAVAEALNEASRRLVDGFERSRSSTELARTIYYLIVGSANHDYRSMFMDGEASMLLSGGSTVVGLIDFALIINLSVWIDDLGMLDAMVPPPTPLQRKFARWVRSAL